MSIHQAEASVTRTQGPSQEQWESFRPLITQLYHVEKKKVDLVRRILENHYGFIANNQMYKKRISKWGLDKKRKRPEMLHAARISKCREQSGKASRIIIRGQDVTQEDIQRYFARAPLQDHEKELDTDMDGPPTDLRISTPSPVLAQRCVLDHAIHSSEDDAARRIHYHFNHLNTDKDHLLRLTGTSRMDPTRDDQMSCLNPEQRALIALNTVLQIPSMIEMTSYHGATLNLMSNIDQYSSFGLQRKFWKCARTIFVDGENIVRTCNSLNISLLLRILHYFSVSFLPELSQRLILHLHRFAVAFHRKCHPTVDFMRAMSKATWKTILPQAMSDISECVIKQLGYECDGSLFVLRDWLAMDISPGQCRSIWAELDLVDPVKLEDAGFRDNYYQLKIACLDKIGDPDGAINDLHNWKRYHHEFGEPNVNITRQVRWSLWEVLVLLKKGQLLEVQKLLHSTWTLARNNFGKDHRVIQQILRFYLVFGFDVPDPEYLVLDDADDELVLENNEVLEAGTEAFSEM